MTAAGAQVLRLLILAIAARRIAAENRLWGQKRIRAELARLGFQRFRQDWPNICEYVAAEGQPGVPDAAFVGHFGVD
jgi:hypothetical protein